MSWHISNDGERYFGDYETEGEAITDGVRMFWDVATGKHKWNDLYSSDIDHPEFYVGYQSDKYTGIEAVDEDDILYAMQQDALSQFGEFADGWLDGLSKHDRELLRNMLCETVAEWLKRTGNIPTFYHVVKPRVVDPTIYTIDEED